MLDEYLRAVGFSSINRVGFRKLMRNLEMKPDRRCISDLHEDEMHVEHYLEYDGGIGVLGRGILDGEKNIFIDSCEPCVYSDSDIEVKDYSIEYIDDSTTIVIFEDENLGNELVFQLQSNLGHKQNQKPFSDSEINGVSPKKINIAGLSLYATIVLPVSKEGLEDELQDAEAIYHKNLITNSRNGDKEAIELLTLYEQHTTDVICERLEREDFLSVVEGYLWPSEEDELAYNILGDIEKVDTVMNTMTGEEVYKLNLDIMGVKIQVFINKYDITGFPIKGMRFMGGCKLQGTIMKD